MNITYKARYVIRALLVLCLTAQIASALTVEELLAELPAKDTAHAVQLYEQLATGDEAVIVTLCDSVVLWTEGADPRIPTALHGLANLVMRPENAANRAKVIRLYEAALNRVKDIEVKRFFMNLLRVCGNADSLEVLAPYLCDVDLYDDAIYTIEAIGGDKAIALLKENKCSDMPAAFSVAVATALMRMNDTVMIDKETTVLDRAVIAASMTPPAPENREHVATLCREALHNQELAPHIRTLALRALVNTIGKSALPELLQAGESNEPVLWGMALQLSESLSGIEVSQAWVQKLDSLPEPVRPQAIYMLGGRNDSAARDALCRVLHTEKGDMLLAACDAVGRYTDKEDFMRHLEAAMFKAESSKEVNAIKTVLMQFPEPELNEVAAQRVLQGDALQRVAYLNILASRHAEQHLRPVRECLENETPEVRRAALDALAAIGANEDVAPVFEHLLAEESTREADAARNALIAIANRYETRPALLERVVNTFADADLDKQVRLLKTFDALGDKEALAEVGKIAEASLFGEGRNVALGNAVLETLGAWKSAAACDLLLDLLGRMKTPEMRQEIVKQIVMAARRVYSEPEKQIEFLEKAKALVSEETEVQPLAAAIEKIQSEQKK